MTKFDKVGVSKGLTHMVSKKIMNKIISEVRTRVCECGWTQRELLSE